MFMLRRKKAPEKEQTERERDRDASFLASSLARVPCINPFETWRINAMFWAAVLVTSGSKVKQVKLCQRWNRCITLVFLLKNACWWKWLVCIYVYVENSPRGYTKNNVYSLFLQFLVPNESKKKGRGSHLVCKCDQSGTCWHLSYIHNLAILWYSAGPRPTSFNQRLPIPFVPLYILPGS